MVTGAAWKGQQAQKLLYRGMETIWALSDLPLSPDDAYGIKT